MDKITFLKAIIQARAMQLFYHNSHNLVAGESFFADHEFFNSSYEAMEESYDRLAEHYISVFGIEAFETKAITIMVAEQMIKYEVEKMCCCDKFKAALELETELYEQLSELDEKGSIGLRNMVGDLAEQSDVRQYKIKQRLKDLDEDDK